MRLMNDVMDQIEEILVIEILCNADHFHYLGGYINMFFDVSRIAFDEKHSL